jgi:hypothetical protein
MAWHVSMGGVLPPEWAGIEPLVVGRAIPDGPSSSAPERFVTLADGGRLVLRVDVYKSGPQCCAFEDAILWRDNLIIGFGSWVHAIPVATRKAISFDVDPYFGHLYPTADYLLIASGVCLYRMEPDCSLLWESPRLGIDGVVVHEAGPQSVRGDGEWDPPGGWQPFLLSAHDGKPRIDT